MSGYSKNLAVIRTLKDGFSADGGELKGLVKCEKYGSRLTVEVTFINFAPLSEGRFVTAVTDGTHTVVVENGEFDGVSEVDTSRGFAAQICFVKGAVFPVASAICGNYGAEALKLKAEVERLENLNADKKQAEQAEKYEDEAIADENYYEFETDEVGGALREDPPQEKRGDKARENEKNTRSVEEEQTPLIAETAAYMGGNSEKCVPPLARGGFYEKVKGEIEGIFSQYPRESSLENLIAESRWAKIAYGDGKYYVFGVIYSDGVAEYICYGVPSDDPDTPPESMTESCSFIPAADGESAGFWVMYQDAATGATLKITNG